MLSVKSLSVGYRDNVVLRDVSFALERGTFTALLGANGEGKSTLLRTLSSVLPLLGGEILLDGSDISLLSRRERARKIAYLSQSRDVPDMSVEELVGHGRYPYLSFPRILRDSDRNAISQAIGEMGLEEIRGRNLRKISGGQRQKAYIALALASECPLLLLDEPGAHLDAGVALETYEILRTLAKSGRTLLVSMHDIPSALTYADSLILINDGAVTYSGEPSGLVDSPLTLDAFGVSVQEESGRYYVERG